MNKLVIISGSSGGIGKALVEAYHDDNFVVIGLDCKKFHKNDFKNFHEINCDLVKFSKNEIYRSEISAKIKQFIPKNLKDFCIVNNAAQQIIKEFKNINNNDWDNSFSVNTIAPFFLIQEHLDELIDCSGNVVNISSIHSKLTKKGFACYAASKAALESLTRSLAIDLSPLGISVNSVSPAAISTDMLSDSFSSNQEKFKELKNYHPSKDIGNPRELAVLIKTITDYKGKFLTGARVSVTGGIEGVLHDPDC